MQKLRSSTLGQQALLRTFVVTMVVRIFLLTNGESVLASDHLESGAGAMVAIRNTSGGSISGAVLLAGPNYREANVVAAAGEGGLSEWPAVPLPAGWSYWISAEGFASRHLQESTAPDGGIVVLVPAASVSGHVVNPFAGAIVGASVQVLSAGSVKAALTDEKGRFEVDGLSPGEVRIVGSAAGFLRSQRTVDVAPGSKARIALPLYRPATLTLVHRRREAQDAVKKSGNGENARAAIRLKGVDGSLRIILGETATSDRVKNPFEIDRLLPPGG